MSPEERRDLAQIQFVPKSERPSLRCPFMSTPANDVACSKEGGVCSRRKYERLAETGKVVVPKDQGSLRTMCPKRFEEGREIFRWIGEVVLNEPGARPIGQVNFLRRPGDDSGRENVGRIDNVLVVPGSEPLQWCAVEIQAVYFSGKAMKLDFQQFLQAEHGLPFPAVVRRPDYRSSGPKRLMPQLQIKVPTLSTWGRKMAVVVDAQFFKAMGKIKTVDEITNCHVAWFVVDYDEDLKLVWDSVHLTTLQESVQGLVAGLPVSLPQFEERILAKLSRLSPTPG